MELSKHLLLNPKSTNILLFFILDLFNESRLSEEKIEKRDKSLDVKQVVTKPITETKKEKEKKTSAPDKSSGGYKAGDTIEFDF